MATTGAMLTFEQFERLPDRPGKSELLRGELIELPPADYDHHQIAEMIRDILKAALGQAHGRGNAQDPGRTIMKWDTAWARMAGLFRTLA